MLLEVEFEAGVHDLHKHLVVLQEIHEHFLHPAGPRDAVDEIHIPRRPETDGVAVFQRLALPADGRVVEPIRAREMRAVEFVERLDARVRQVA